MPGKSSHTPSVYVLGIPDPASCGLAACVRHLKIHIRYFSQEAEFLAESVNKPPDCLVIDLDCFANAVELQAKLRQRDCRAVVIATATDLEVDKAIEVMEHGALTLLRKPVQAGICERYLQRAIEIARQERELRLAYLSFVEKQAGLSERQRDILWSVLAGLPTKAIAVKLDVSNRLVELERARLLKVFQAESTTELALMVGEYLMLQRTLAQPIPPHFSRLRSTVNRDTPWASDDV